jgi:hypothetical protein
MFERAATMSFKTRMALAVVVSLLVTAYCYVTTRRRQLAGKEDPSTSPWGTCAQLFVVSLVTIYLISGLFGSPRKNTAATRSVGGGTEAIGGGGASLAMSFADPNPAPF